MCLARPRNSTSSKRRRGGGRRCRERRLGGRSQWRAAERWQPDQMLRGWDAGVLGAPHSASSDMKLPLPRSGEYGACDVGLQVGDGLGARGRGRKRSSLTPSLALAARIAESANLAVDEVGLHEDKTERCAAEGGRGGGRDPATLMTPPTTSCTQALVDTSTRAAGMR